MKEHEIIKGRVYRRADGVVRRVVAIKVDYEVPSGATVLYQEVEEPRPVGAGSADLGVFARGSIEEVEAVPVCPWCGREPVWTVHRSEGWKDCYQLGCPRCQIKGGAMDAIGAVDQWAVMCMRHQVQRADR